MHDALTLRILSTGLEMGYLTLAGSLRVSSLLWGSVCSPRPPTLHYYRGVVVVVLQALILVFPGTALPVLLAHSDIIVVPAMIMSIIGGLLIYGTVITFITFFQEESDF